MARLRLLAAAALPLAAHAGMGYSTVRLNPCDSSGSAAAYQQWATDLPKGYLFPSNGNIFNQADVNIDAIGPAVANATLWTSPGSRNLPVSLTNSGANTAIFATKANLCFAVMQPAAPGSGLWLQPCAAGAPEQTFQVRGKVIVHPASGLCVDAGSRVHPCQPGSNGAGLPWCNVSLPFPARVADLVSRLSVVEKLGMLDTSSGGSGGVGLPGWQWWNEGAWRALAGRRTAGVVRSFIGCALRATLLQARLR